MSKIDWRITPQSLKTDLRAAALVRAVQAVCSVDADGLSELRNYAMLLSCINGIEFDRTTARPALLEFAKVIAAWETMEPAAVWAYRFELPTAIWWAWVAAFNDGQELFNPDPAELPLEALTPEQREEAETPGSPLTSVEPSLVSS